jgi:hypothetical protein
VSEQVCSAVLVGSTGVGKSTMLNGMLMLTEVDEITYASPSFHDTAPRITVPTLKKPTPMEYRLEGIQARGVRTPRSCCALRRTACTARIARTARARPDSCCMAAHAGVADQGSADG